MLLGKDETKLQRYTQAQIFMDRIMLAAHKVKPGDKLTIWTLKCSTTDACNNRTEVHRKAKVIAVYPHKADKPVSGEDRARRELPLGRCCEVE